MSLLDTLKKAKASALIAGVSFLGSTGVLGATESDQSSAPQSSSTPPIVKNVKDPVSQNTSITEEEQAEKDVYIAMKFIMPHESTCFAQEWDISDQGEISKGRVIHRPIENFYCCTSGELTVGFGTMLSVRGNTISDEAKKLIGILDIREKPRDRAGDLLDDYEISGSGFKLDMDGKRTWLEKVLENPDNDRLLEAVVIQKGGKKLTMAKKKDLVSKLTKLHKSDVQYNAEHPSRPLTQDEKEEAVIKLKRQWVRMGSPMNMLESAYARKPVFRDYIVTSESAYKAATFELLGKREYAKERMKKNKKQDWDKLNYFAKTLFLERGYIAGNGGIFDLKKGSFVKAISRNDVKTAAQLAQQSKNQPRNAGRLHLANINNWLKTEMSVYPLRDDANAETKNQYAERLILRSIAKHILDYRSELSQGGKSVLFLEASLTSCVAQIAEYAKGSELTLEELKRVDRHTQSMFYAFIHNPALSKISPERRETALLLIANNIYNTYSAPNHYLPDTDRSDSLKAIALATQETMSLLDNGDGKSLQKALADQVRKRISYDKNVSAMAAKGKRIVTSDKQTTPNLISTKARRDGGR